jgi:hypothetical protein
MSMGACRLGLAVIAALTLLVAAKSEPARAGSAGALVALQADTAMRPVLSLPVGAFHHSRRVQSYYCYPRNYWWFYRPYTTGQDGHARCMPYFHYPPSQNGARSGRYIK